MKKTQLEKLKLSLTELSKNDALQLVLKIREERKIRKESLREKKTRRVKKRKELKSLKSELFRASPEELEELRKLLKLGV